MAVTYAWDLHDQIVDGFNTDGDPKGPAVHYPSGALAAASCTITAS